MTSEPAPSCAAMTPGAAACSPAGRPRFTGVTGAAEPLGAEKLGADGAGEETPPAGGLDHHGPWHHTQALR
eukprot:6373682-Pyramimonas_sp.AAC.1